MEDLKVDTYVRTGRGIFKIVAIDKNKPINRYVGDNGHDCDNEGDRVGTIIKTTDIVEYSNKPIDLIKPGDIVNGEVVMLVHETGAFYEHSSYEFEEKTLETHNDHYETVPTEYFYTNEQIHTILTTEQYKRYHCKIEKNLSY